MEGKCSVKVALGAAKHSSIAMTAYKSKQSRFVNRRAAKSFVVPPSGGMPE
jgi:hypothetical protein